MSLLTMADGLSDGSALSDDCWKSFQDDYDNYFIILLFYAAMGVHPLITIAFEIERQLRSASDW